MRRTTIRLAIVALLLGGPAWAQEVIPGQPIDPTQSPAGIEAPGPIVSDDLGGVQQPVVPSPPGPVGAPAHQPQWQPWQSMEPIVPTPDVTTSNVGVPPGTVPMIGPPMPPPKGPCCEKTAKGYCCPPNWSLDQRVRWMHHPKPRGTMIADWLHVEEDLFNGQFFDDFLFRTDAMSTRSVPMAPSAGYEITISRYLGRDSDNRDQFLEFTYYGLMDWEREFGVHQTERATAVDPVNNPNNANRKWPGAENLAPGQTETFGNLSAEVFDTRLTGFNRADDVWERYASRFDNFELNMRIRPRLRHDRMILYQNGCWRREAQDDLVVFSFLGGLRGMSLDESYSIVGTGLIEVDNPNSPDTTQATRGEFDCRTHNDLVGLQIGGDAVYHKGFLDVGMRMKAGVFINFADQTSSILSTGGLYDPMGDPELYDANGPYTDIDNQFSARRTARSRDVAGVAELGFTAGYQIRANMVVRAAYDLMWLSGVALAPEQISGQIGTHGFVNRNGLQFMQSLSLGLELDW